MKRISSALLAPIVVVVFFGGIVVSMALNLWVTESSKVAAKFSSGEFRGVSNPADIRGSYTLSEIESNFAVPVEVLARAFGAEALPEPSAFQVKGLEGAFPPVPDGGEIGTDSVRLFVARYLGLPYAPAESTRLPTAAVEVLREKLSPADLEALWKITVGFEPEATPAPAPVDAVPAADGTAAEPGTQAAKGTSSAGHTTEETGRTVTGNTTFYDLLSWGVSRETISQVLGKPMGPASQTVRDFCRTGGLSFSEMKTKLQTEVPAE